MSSLAFPLPRSGRRSARGRILSVCETHGSDVILAVVVMACAAVLITSLPSAFDVDSWLELVSGRFLVQHGLPHQETLTLIAHGRPWIDQQWLAQLAAYGLYGTGGLALLGLVDVALMIGAVTIAVVGARRLGAKPAVVLALVGLAAFMIVPSREVRTQAFAMPLFAVVAYLLCRDSRRPTRCVLVCLPILVLWANLHGSATVGAALVALRGVTLAASRRPALRDWRAWRRPAALVLGAPLCLLLTPYGLGAISYYKATIFSSTLRSVTEWQPITSSPLSAVVFFLLAGVALWSFGRSPARTTAWERLAIIVLGAATIDSIRNALFFGLLAIIVLPVSLGALSRRPAAAAAPARPWLNASLLAGAALALLVAGLVTVARPASALELNFQRTGALRAVETATARDPAIRVMAEDRYSDWLLWRDPALGGRIANDVRFELLTPAQMASVNRLFAVVGTDWKAAARGYRLIVLDRIEAPLAVRAFESEPGSRVLYDDGVRAVILRSAREAG